MAVSIISAYAGTVLWFPVVPPCFAAEQRHQVCAAQETCMHELSPISVRAALG